MNNIKTKSNSYIVNINSNFRDENGERTIRIFTNDGRYHDIVIPSVSGSSSSRKNSSSQVSIASNGNWEIDGKDTGQSSKGQDGKDGTSGSNGKSTYVAYADDSDGNGFSITDSNKGYIGFCTIESDTQPTDPSAYKWTKAKGEKGDQGIQGEKGEDGKDGVDGTNGESILTGHGAPSSDLGTNGDKYLDLDTYDLYEKSNGSWSKIGNIKGEQGEKGDKGEDGSDSLFFNEAPDSWGLGTSWYNLNSIREANDSQDGWYLITPGSDAGVEVEQFSMCRTDGKDNINGYGTSANNPAQCKYIKVYLQSAQYTLTKIEYSWSSDNTNYVTSAIGATNNTYIWVNTATVYLAFFGEEEPTSW